MYQGGIALEGSSGDNHGDVHCTAPCCALRVRVLDLLQSGDGLYPVNDNLVAGFRGVRSDSRG